jgi:hypothetical protein
MYVFPTTTGSGIGTNFVAGSLSYQLALSRLVLDTGPLSHRD